MIEFSKISLIFDGIFNVVSFEIELFSFKDDHIRIEFDESIDFGFKVFSSCFSLEIELSKRIRIIFNFLHSVVNVTLFIEEHSIPSFVIENVENTDQLRNMQSRNSTDPDTWSQFTEIIMMHKVIPFPSIDESVNP